MKNPIILFCLLTSVSVFSQNKFPAVINFNGDTVIAILPKQMDTISERLFDCERLSLADSLIASQIVELSKARQLEHEQFEIIRDYTTAVLNQKQIINNKDFVIQNKDTEIAVRKKRNRNAWLIGVPVGIGFGGLIGVVSTFLIRH